MSKDEKLQEYFEFTESDLQENRLGNVSEDQEFLINENAWKDAGRITAVFAALGVLVFVFIQPQSSDSGNSLMYPGILALIAVVSIGLRFIKKSNLSLESVEGEVNFVWEERRIRDVGRHTSQTTTPRLKMYVGGKSFDAREELMDILDQGDNCRFYYTGGGDIVSAEYVDKS